MSNHRPNPEDVGLRYLSVAYRIRRAVDSHMVTGGPSLARTKILQVLAESGPLRQAALATRLGQAARSVTQAVEGMERDGLVSRKPDPDDRRAKIVGLTGDGFLALTTGTAAGTQALRQIFGGLDPAQLASLDELLGRLEALQDRATMPP